MEEIDKDLIVEIPDTPPDRLPVGNGGRFVRKESTLLSAAIRNPNFIPEENLTRPIIRINNRMKNESAHSSRGVHIHPPKPPVSIGEKVGNHSRLFRKTSTDKNTDDDIRSLFVNKGKAICDEKVMKRGARMAPHHSSLLSATNCSKTNGGELKGKEKVVENSNNYRRSDSADNKGNGADVLSNDTQHVTPPRVGGRKRLVRNGCISPQNIATMAQQTEHRQQNVVATKAAEQNPTINMASNSNGSSSFDINEIVSEDNFRDRVRGKRVSNEHDAEIIDLSGSTPRNKHKEARESCRELDGWRRTHNNPTRNTHSLSTEVVGSHFAKRQKTELPLINSVGMGSGYSEIVFLNSSGRASSSSSSTIPSHRPRGSPAPTVVFDDLSPAIRHIDAQAGQMSNDQSDARLRQLQADEALARELQEQLYGEETMLGGSAIDENIAWSLQQEEDLPRAPSNRGRQAARPRTGSRAPPPSNRTTGIQARGRRGAARRSRLRSRIFGRSQAPPASMFGDVNFPLGMGLDMRLDMLEALEAAIGDSSGVRTASHIQHLQRDFNENDYEMLLALDDNNHQHGGASTNLINRLPESTVQSVSRLQLLERPFVTFLAYTNFTKK
ncbi:hypothetical protein ACFE04_014235 [Oxalis oulophora]